MRENWTLRSAGLSDIVRLRELIPASVRALSASVYSRSQIEAALERIFGVDTKLIEDGTYFVADVAGTIVGAGGWSRRRTLFGGDQFKNFQEDERLDPRREPGRIRAFYVDPAWARRGIASAILARCEAEAKAEGFTRLELLATLPGVPLYAALGYSEIEPLNVPMGEGLTLPAIVMGKMI
jgi:GNAT superfamily N-acetyltransferase